MYKYDIDDRFIIPRNCDFPAYGLDDEIIGEFTLPKGITITISSTYFQTPGLSEPLYSAEVYHDIYGDQTIWLAQGYLDTCEMIKTDE